VCGFCDRARAGALGGGVDAGWVKCGSRGGGAVCGRAGPENIAGGVRGRNQLAFVAQIAQFLRWRARRQARAELRRVDSRRRIRKSVLHAPAQQIFWQNKDMRSFNHLDTREKKTRLYTTARESESTASLAAVGVDDPVLKQEKSKGGQRVRGIGAVPLGVRWKRVLTRRLDAMTVPSEFSARQCVEFLRALRSQQAENISVDGNGYADSVSPASSEPPPHDVVYVLDSETSGLVGYVHMEDLLMLDPDEQSATQVGQMARKCETVVYEDESLERASARMRSAGIMSAPVVDADNHKIMVGVLSAADLVREMEDEASDELYRFGGVMLDEENGGAGAAGMESYFDVPLRAFIRSRAAWLVALLLLQSLSSVVLSRFQPLVQAHVVLALFLTMLTGTGGNAGNQSSALVIRGLATGEISWDNARRVFLREFIVGMCIALVLGSVGFIRVYVTSGQLEASLAVSTALMFTVMFGVAFGTLSPIVLQRLGVDPCNCASPALSTVTDIAGVLLLCLTASAILH